MTLHKKVWVSANHLCTVVGVQIKQATSLQHRKRDMSEMTGMAMATATARSLNALVLVEGVLVELVRP